MANYRTSYISGQTYGVTIQGTTCDSSFYDEDCFKFYRARLLNSLKTFQVKLHAYFLDKQTINLLLTPLTPQGLHGLLEYLNDSYSEYFNTRFERSKRVWESCPRLSLIQGDQLALDCQKYIERLPLETGRSAHPGAYEWSSYCSNSFGVRSPYLTPHPAFTKFLASDPNPYLRYRDFISAPYNKGYVRYLESRLKQGLPMAKRRLKLSVPMAVKKRRHDVPVLKSVGGTA